MICSYHSFRLLRTAGTRQTIHIALRKRSRQRLERATTPSAAILDSQLVKAGQRRSARLSHAQAGEGAQEPGEADFSILIRFMEELAGVAVAPDIA